MLHITGDTHGDFIRFDDFGKYGEQSWTNNDYLIVCGDFGYLFANDEKERKFLDELENKRYSICFCDGNHENFPAINSYPLERWSGGNIHRIRRNIIHLMRGQVYTIDGKTLFVMGGAYSTDKRFRTEGKFYWQEELPSDSEYKEASKNLKECGNHVDYIITHTAPREIIRKMGNHPDYHDAELTGFLEWVMYEVEFKQWFFGHWHTDKVVNDRFRALWFDVVDL